jgi:hypothetical protein
LVQKVLAEFAFRWNYSPLKRKGHPVAGWPFRLHEIISAGFIKNYLPFIFYPELIHVAFVLSVELVDLLVV